MQNYSVLMSVYAKEKPEYLRLSMQSMWDQTVPTNDFVLVCDGPLTDGLNEVIDDMQCQHGDVLNVVRLEKNVGLGLALNEGLSNCKNELVARMDSDDISLPTRCEKQLKCFRENVELDIVGCPVKEFVGDVENVVGKRNVPVTNEEVHKFAKQRDPFNHPTVMYRKSMVLKFGPYRNYRNSQDSALWVDMLSQGCQGENLEEYLFFFRFDEKTYKKRKSWVNTKCLISTRWEAYQKNVSGLWDFIYVACGQIAIFLLPQWFEKFVYKKILKR